jgi:hypothetical protein
VRAGKDAAIAKPTERARERKGPADATMKKDGANTARMQSMASIIGTATSETPSRTARARVFPRARWVWMFSMATVDSSTRIPIASVSPPRVMMLIV